ncbi:DNA-binding transcriptional regulator, XRE-family HTH domain [Pedobacter westerhofensis]|uniref:DNA-binding transcriptional regulator, XRE-family HTH domain n=1 Tax=Pedobacter westerhofensis TaxID=425512 RepID=A0A521BAZ0_9SPHI|nr:helix-turn-helix transcriptional regulator [Pedobacter westerhofensis]SMO44239.1 DNA-binding transcriptional regulator, XRE-family HTH domain [Pedobacter westerhofensis]
MEKIATSKLVGQRIKKLRQKLNWVQQDVAQKLDISIPAYSKIETGITDINISRLIQLAELFSVHVKDLIMDDAQVSAIDQKPEISRLSQLIDERAREILILQAKIIDLYEERDKGKGN